MKEDLQEPKKKRGRPPINKEDRKMNFQVRFDQRQIDAINAVAKAKNITFSEVIRAAVDEYLLRTLS